MKRKKILLINEKITLWDFVWKYTLRDSLLGVLRNIPASFGVGARLVFLPFFLKKCGRGLTVKEGVIFKFPERVEIGDHVGIGEYTLIDGDGGVKIGSFVRIASHVSIISFEHRYERVDIPIKLQGKIKKEVVIEDDVWIGTGARILTGVKISKGSVIGAGSVVTKNIPSFSVAAGVPAKVKKKRKREKD